MDKERLNKLLATAHQAERQALMQLAWTQGRIAQLEELLTMPGEGEDDSGDTEELSGNDS